MMNGNSTISFSESHNIPLKHIKALLAGNALSYKKTTNKTTAPYNNALRQVVWFDFTQRTEDKVTFAHEWMGNGEFWSGELEVSVKEDVDVNGTVGIMTSTAFVGTTELTFNGLCLIQQLLGCKVGK